MKDIYDYTFTNEDTSNHLPQIIFTIEFTPANKPLVDKLIETVFEKNPNAFSIRQVGTKVDFCTDRLKNVFDLGILYRDIVLKETKIK